MILRTGGGASGSDTEVDYGEVVGIAIGIGWGMAEGVRFFRQKEKGEKEENTVQLTCVMEGTKSLLFPYFLIPFDEKKKTPTTP